ncbi:hypothetical protein, partial [Paenibacillus sp. KS1]|uniref:hypothetical protein n=1 Tax=Paenibacillus sp. KS1 TaxID=1849249 RepID=UPI001C308B75
LFSFQRTIFISCCSDIFQHLSQQELYLITGANLLSTLFLKSFFLEDSFEALKLYCAAASRDWIYNISWPVPS